MVSLGRFRALSSSASFSLISWIGFLFVVCWNMTLEYLERVSVQYCFPHSPNIPSTAVFGAPKSGNSASLESIHQTFSFRMEKTSHYVFFWLPCHQRGCQPAPLRAQMLTNQPIQAPGQSLWKFVTRQGSRLTWKKSLQSTSGLQNLTWSSPGWQVDIGAPFFGFQAEGWVWGLLLNWHFSHVTKQKKRIK